MSEEIKCPICHEMSEIRYSENRVYQSRCQNIKCHETVTVTASSESAAEELFSKFEKGTNQPQLTIPKSIADELDENYNNNHSLAWFDSPLSQNILNWYDENHNNWNIANIYINSKSLGVDLVKVVEG